jgi:hypothetical protein
MDEGSRIQPDGPGDISDLRPGQGINGRIRPEINRVRKENSRSRHQVARAALCGGRQDRRFLEATILVVND